MSLYRPSPQRRVLLGTLVLLSVTVMTLDFRTSGGFFESARDATGSLLSPVRRGASAVIQPISDFFSGLARSGATREENERLRAEIASLRERVNELSSGQAHVEELEKLANLPLPRDIEAIGARVFASSASTLEWTVEIDIGANRGVQRGHPVVSGDGLVGRVEVVRANTASVLLVTDPEFRAGARLERSGERGTVSGHGTAPLTLGFIDPQLPVDAGDRVVTAGGPASRFPADILIGTVRDASPPSASAERAILVEPSMKASRLRFVKVLLY